MTKFENKVGRRRKFRMKVVANNPVPGALVRRQTSYTRASGKKPGRSRSRIEKIGIEESVLKGRRVAIITS